MSTSTKIKMIDHALAYARSGWVIFPLKPQSKTPITKHGVIDATTDEKTIRAWWARWPTSNIGLACGASGIVAIDCDSDQGIEAWAQFEIDHKLRYKTRVSVTPGKQGKGQGRHILFRAPPGIELSNTAGKIAPGIDTRAGNGYIVLPPSVHPDHLRGPRYQWENERATIADMPQALIEVLTRPEAATPAAVRTTPQAATSANGQHDLSHYADRAFSDEIATLRAATEGTRNAQLNRSAFALGQLVGAGLLVRSEVENALTSTANAIGLANDPNCGPRGIAKTIASGLQDGIASPRDLSKIEDRRNGHGPGAAIDLSLAPDDEHEHAPARLHTDKGNGERMADLFAGRLRYTEHWGWLAWDDGRYQRDETGAAMRAAKQVSMSIFDEAKAEQTKAQAAIEAIKNAVAQGDDKAKERAEQEKAQAEDRAAKALAWAIKTQARPRLEAMLTLAQSERRIVTHYKHFDRDPYLLNVHNGTIDLRTGDLLPHSPANLITKLAGTHYDRAATCPRWLAFLDRIMAGDREMIAFLRRAVGYTLTGTTGAQCLFFMFGTGANGKSTFIETLIALLGDYACKTPTGTIIQKSFDDNGLSNDLARLAGARMAIAAELPSGKRLDEEKIKDMTGGDTIAARFLRKEFFEFTPIFKLWMYGNHKPPIVNTDEAIWRRINLIPFEVTIPKHERDPKLRDTLKTELPGILAWAIEGCLEWQAREKQTNDGLAYPEKVKRATADYRSEMDTLAPFFDEYFVIKPEAITTNKDMYAALREWAIANGEVDRNGKPTISQKALATQLIERGYKQDRSGTLGRYWRGLGLLKRPEIDNKAQNGPDREL